MSLPARRAFLSGAALCLGVATAGCSSFGRGEPQQEHDERFAEFTEYVPEPLSVRTDTDFVSVFMPGLHLVSGHFVCQYWQAPREVIPPQDRPLWVHMVAEVAAEDAQALSAAAAGQAGLLPPVYPDLHQYVPQGTRFMSVGTPEADDLLRVEDAKSQSQTNWWITDELVVCGQQSLVVITGMIVHT